MTPIETITKWREEIHADFVAANDRVAAAETELTDAQKAVADALVDHHGLCVFLEPVLDPRKDWATQRSLPQAITPAVALRLNDSVAGVKAAEGRLARARNMLEAERYAVEQLRQSIEQLDGLLAEHSANIEAPASDVVAA